MNISGVSLAALAGLAAGSASADSHLAPIEAAPRGPVVECSGSVKWDTGSDGNAADPVPMSFAVRDAPDADRVALYDVDQPFLEENVWPCQEGLCTAFRVMRSGVTANVLRLTPSPEAADTEYLAQWAFVVIGASSTAFEPESTTGEGVFECSDTLSENVLASALWRFGGRCADAGTASLVGRRPGRAGNSPMPSAWP